MIVPRDDSIKNFYLSTCFAVNSLFGKPRIEEAEIIELSAKPPSVTVKGADAVDENLLTHFTNPRIEIFMNLNNLDRVLKEFNEFTKNTLKNNNDFGDYNPTIKDLSKVYKNIISTYGTSSNESFQLMKENLFNLLVDIQASNANEDMKSDLKDALKRTLAKSLQELNKFEHQNILQQNDILNRNSNFIKAYDREIYHGSTAYHRVLYSNANPKVPIEERVKSFTATSGERLPCDNGLYGDGVYFSTFKSATGYAEHYCRLFDREEAVVSSHSLTKEQRLFDLRFERAFVKVLSEDPHKLFDKKNSEWTNQNLAIYQKFLKQYQGWLSSKFKESIILDSLIDKKNDFSIDDTYKGRSNQELWGSQEISKTLIGVQKNLEIIDKVIKNSDREDLEFLRGLKCVSGFSPQLIGKYCSELGFDGLIATEYADWQAYLKKNSHYDLFRFLSKLKISVTESKLAVEDIELIKDVYKKIQKDLEKQPEHYKSLDIRHHYLKELIQFVENRSVDKPDQDLVLSKRDDEYLKHLLKQFGSYGADQFNLMINLFDRGDGIPVCQRPIL